MARPAVTQHHIVQLLEKYHLLSALQILEKLEDKAQGVNKTTVYRALDKMLEEGSICRQVFGDDMLMYELRTDHHHDHLVCESCGKVQETSCQTESKKTIDGFVIGHHHTTFFGLCSTCANK